MRREQEQLRRDKETQAYEIELLQRERERLKHEIERLKQEVDEIIIVALPNVPTVVGLAFTSSGPISIKPRSCARCG